MVKRTIDETIDTLFKVSDTLRNTYIKIGDYPTMSLIIEMLEEIASKYAREEEKRKNEN